MGSWLAGVGQEPTLARFAAKLTLRVRQPSNPPVEFEMQYPSGLDVSIKPVAILF
jgi:hypothetical protein